MGCFTSKSSKTDDSDEELRNDRIKETIWEADQPLLESKLRSMRQEFWDTQPHYGGDKGMDIGRWVYHLRESSEIWECGEWEAPRPTSCACGPIGS